MPIQDYFLEIILTSYGAISGFEHILIGLLCVIRGGKTLRGSEREDKTNSPNSS